MSVFLEEETKNSRQGNKVLDDQFVNYKEGRLDKENFVCKVYDALVNSFKRYNVFRFQETFWEDFLASIFYKVREAIDKYSEQDGITFSNYMFSMLRYWRLSWLSREKNNSTTEMHVWQTRAEEAAAFEMEMEYLPDLEANMGETQAVMRNPQQILILALKSYYCISDKLLAKISCAAGIEMGKLLQLIEALHMKRQRMEEKFFDLREKVFSQYYRNVAMERQYLFNKEEGLPLEALRAKIKKGRKQQDSLRKKLKSMRIQASNHDIADVLGITKGAVDSSMCILKNKHRCI